jgi:hypothetical protein
MPSVTGLIQGVGGETPFIEAGRQRKREEGRQDIYDKLALEEAAQSNERNRLLMQQTRQQLERMITIGNPQRQQDGTFKQVVMDPRSGSISAIPIPGLTQMSPGEETAEEYKKVTSKYGKDVADRILPQHNPPPETEAQKRTADYAQAEQEARRLGYIPGTKKYKEAVFALLKATGPETRGLFDYPFFNPNVGNSNALSTDGMTPAQARLFNAEASVWKPLLTDSLRQFDQTLKASMDPTNLGHDTAQNELSNIRERIEYYQNQIENIKRKIMHQPELPKKKQSKLDQVDIPNSLKGIIRGLGVKEFDDDEPQTGIDIPKPIASVRTPKPSPGTKEIPQDVMAFSRNVPDGNIFSDPRGDKWIKRNGKVEAYEEGK